ncbi:13372_t:CDS:2, partial [Cetraspora pellucida]
ILINIPHHLMVLNPSISSDYLSSINSLDDNEDSDIQNYVQDISIELSKRISRKSEEIEEIETTLRRL